MSLAYIITGFSILTILFSYIVLSFAFSGKLPDLGGCSPMTVVFLSQSATVELYILQQYHRELVLKVDFVAIHGRLYSECFAQRHRSMASSVRICPCPSPM